MYGKPKVLIIDDDASHLKLYAWVLERGGYVPVTALVDGQSLQLPAGDSIHAAVVDYSLGGKIGAVEVIERIKTAFPAAPVIVLSDMFWMPDDVAPFAAAFVRKGEPEVLINTIAAVLDSKNPPPQP